MGTAPPPKVQIKHTPDKGRGVFLEEGVSARRYIPPWIQDKWGLSLLTEGGKGGNLRYEPGALYDKGRFCLDATRCFNTLGHLLNHAPPCKVTAKPTKPLFVKGKCFFFLFLVPDIQQQGLLSSFCYLGWRKPEATDSVQFVVLSETFELQL